MKKLPHGMAPVALVLVPLVLMHCSCAPTAWMVATFWPPKDVPAQYRPPPGKKILVFVDDMLHPVSYEPIKGELSRRLGEQLVQHKIAAEIVAYERLADLVAATPNFNLLPVSEVGQKLGADIVLYVQVDKFALKDASTDELWRGEFQVTVRMVDVLKGRLWPKGSRAGHLVPAVTTPPSTESSETYADQLTRILAAKTADRVAKLFYKHKAPHEGAWQK